MSSAVFFPFACSFQTAASSRQCATDGLVSLEPRNGVSRDTGQSSQSLQAQVKEFADLNVLPPRLRLGVFLSCSTAFPCNHALEIASCPVEKFHATSLFQKIRWAFSLSSPCCKRLSSQLVFSLLVSFSFWFDRVPGPLFLILFMGAPSIRPDLSSSCRVVDHWMQEVIFQLMCGRCCSCSCCFQVVRSLKGSVHRAPFHLCMDIAQLVTQLMRRHKKHTRTQEFQHTQHKTPQHKRKTQHDIDTHTTHTTHTHTTHTHTTYTTHATRITKNNTRTHNKHTTHSTQHNTTQHNTTQHNTTQHNTTQHNTTQHNRYATQRWNTESIRKQETPQYPNTCEN